MEASKLSEKTREILISRKFMKNAMFYLVFAIIPAFTLGIFSAIELVKGKWMLGLVFLAGSIISCFLVVYFYRRYKKRRVEHKKFLEKHPSVFGQTGKKSFFF